MLFRLALTHHTQTQLSHALPYLSVHLSLPALPLSQPSGKSTCCPHTGPPWPRLLLCRIIHQYCHYFIIIISPLYENQGC